MVELPQFSNFPASWTIIALNAVRLVVTYLQTSNVAISVLPLAFPLANLKSVIEALLRGSQLGKVRAACCEICKEVVKDYIGEREPKAIGGSKGNDERSSSRRLRCFLIDSFIGPIILRTLVIVKKGFVGVLVVNLHYC